MTPEQLAERARIDAEIAAMLRQRAPEYARWCVELETEAVRLHSIGAHYAAANASALAGMFQRMGLAAQQGLTQ